ncbi:MAG: pentapeptide repeat-containing protein [Acidobacteriaceae bacterium]|nr:pentapeptide repeat-containing protein [Acidobacteriaceae bacterium]
MRGTLLRLAASAGLASLCLAQQQEPVPIVGPNINMVSGTTWPTGDPYLQRQNEPSMAISSRNPLHILAGANDYRTVDLPFVNGISPNTPDPSGDAWLGLFKSFDGGRSWISNLVPGYPQEGSDQTRAFQKILGATDKDIFAGADPGVRAGTNGMFYYAGLAFVRQTGHSAIFVARFIDDNNNENGDTIRYIDTGIVTSGGAARGRNQQNQVYFEDKPSIAVDIPRAGAGSCTIPGSKMQGAPPNPQTFAAGNVYVTWTEFPGGEEGLVSSIKFAASDDCGLTWPAEPIDLSQGMTATNQGATIAIDPNNGTIYVAWRVFSTLGKDPDEIVYVASTDFGHHFSKPQVVTHINPFDQATLAQEDPETDPVQFRTNAYPAMTVDAHGRVYIAWSQRCAPADSTGACPTQSNMPIDADLTARIVFVSGSPNPHSCPGESSDAAALASGVGNIRWSLPPVEVDNNSNKPGHQFMPAIASSAGKLTVAWYDQRFDDQYVVYTPKKDKMGNIIGGQYDTDYTFDGGCPLYPKFRRYIKDPSNRRIRRDSPKARRHTLDIRAAQMTSLCTGQQIFGQSVQVSSYEFGANPRTAGQFCPNPIPEPPITQLQVNPPNFPMFATGTESFDGDYIDIAGPVFLPNHDGTWRYNMKPADTDYTHVVWTDNRDVVPPADGIWANYYPPVDGQTMSVYDKSTSKKPCTDATVGNTGDRNQNIYSAALPASFFAAAPTNFKQLTTKFPRQFPIYVQNNTAGPLTYALSIVEPAKDVSFSQTDLTVRTASLTVQANSTGATSVFVKSSDPSQQVIVKVQSPDQSVPTASVVINGDISNPNIQNPNIQNPNIQNPNIQNAEVYNPNIQNPNIQNPNIQNADLSNPNIQNPNIQNLAVANPNIQNPNIQNPNIQNAALANPNIQNPNIQNPNVPDEITGGGQVTDASWTVTNTGNTASSYIMQVNTGAAPSYVRTQVVVWQYYTTPVALGCALTVQSHFLPVLNHYLNKGENGAVTPTVALKPGESALITVRTFDTKATTVATGPEDALKAYNPIKEHAFQSVVAFAANTNSTNGKPPSASPPVNLTVGPPPTVTVKTSPLVLQFGSTVYSGTITLTSTKTYTGPLYLLLTQFPENVSANPITSSSAKGPYMSASGPYYILSNGLVAGQPLTLNVTFTDVSNAPIKFGTGVFDALP